MTVVDKVSKRVLFIGWDGAEPNLVSRLLSEGKLPNLTNLIQHGFYTPLPSTIRPESPTAWTTFATASNPGVHGVYGFMRQISKSYDFEFTNTNWVQTPFFWETLSQHHKRVALLNMPMAYPPRPVNGYLVCGLMAPGPDVVFTYPANLSQRLRAEGYSIDADPLAPGEDRALYLEKMNRHVRERVGTAKKLLGSLDWDFGAVIFTELDRIQHFFWADMDIHHPFHPKEAFPTAIAEHYVTLDHALGELALFAGPDTRLILMSDHGFTPCAQRFYVNAWLCEQGLLHFKNEPSKLQNVSLRLLQGLKKNGLLRKIKRFFWGDKSVLAYMESRSFSKQIDWKRTKAWFSETEGIRINLNGREPQGIVKEGVDNEDLVADLKARLLNVQDPSSGQHIIKSVYRREDIYWGPQIDSAPDLILEPHRDFNNIKANYWLESFNFKDDKAIFGSSEPYSGNHSSAGICASNNIPPFNIQSIDGVSRWIMNSFGVEPEINLSQERNIPLPEVYDESSEKRIRERLEDLGYID
jgi:predicted AlkP superfamily phosphohydrolase/phosphomutase